MMIIRRPRTGYTIVEIIVIITVIAILAAILVTGFNGIRARSQNTKTESDIRSIQELIEAYHARNGLYPMTTTNSDVQNWQPADVFADTKCGSYSGGSDNKRADWVPYLNENLPQSLQQPGGGANGAGGCYLYVSDGTYYVLSAWNMLSAPQTDSMYRRLGFRKVSDNSTQFYTCNDDGIGGGSGSKYDISQDYYKHSYTVSNITSTTPVISCDETPKLPGI